MASAGWAPPPQRQQQQESREYTPSNGNGGDNSAVDDDSAHTEVDLHNGDSVAPPLVIHDFDGIEFMDVERQRKRRRSQIFWTVAVLCGAFVLGTFVALDILLVHRAGGLGASAPTAEDIQWQLLARVFRNDSNITADPCVDFYEYVCGGMIAHTTLDSDESSVGLFDELRAVVDQRLLAVAEAGWPIVSSWFDACEDMHQRDLYSDWVLSTLLRQIDAVNDTDDDGELTHYVLASLHASGVRALFDFDAAVDPLNHTRYLYWLSPATLSLSHAMMLGTDELSIQAQQALLAYIGELFSLAGYGASEDVAASVFGFEQQLASYARAPEAYRDPSALRQFETTLGLIATTDVFDWHVYYSAMLMHSLGIYVSRNSSSSSPEQTVHMDDSFMGSVVDETTVDALPVLALDSGYLNASLALWMSSSVETLQNYLRYRVLATLAGDASSSFVAARNRFVDAIVGLDAPPPLWTQCISSATAALGDLFAHYYVEEFFGDEQSRSMVEALITSMETAFAARLQANTWMDEATREAALLKLQAIHSMVGSPDRWTPDVGFEVYDSAEGGVHVENVLSWRHAVVASELAVVLYAITPQRYPWLMEAFDVNAYYSETSNDIALPAGILQGLFFNKSAPLSVNYGSLGTVVGHELTHGFDDQGRLYDAQGDLHDWWSEQSTEEFEQRAQCVVDLYNSFEGVEGMPATRVNGQLTLGEDLADMGGLHTAYDAHQAALEALGAVGRDRYERRLREVFRGATPQQLFFHSYAHMFCTKERVESAYAALTSDPHAPARWRVNGPLSQMVEFSRAYQCAPPPTGTCQVW